jgi:dipeptidyl aminopeptidase/acylaminoacyl peptidase
MKKIRLLSLVTFVFSGLASQAPVEWQLPPEPIAHLVTAVPAPTTELSPCRRFLLLIEREALPGIEVLARPYKKMAGSRIDPKTRGPQLGTKVLRILLRDLASGQERLLAIPAGHVSSGGFSADGERLAFLRATDSGIELWLLLTATGAVQKVAGVVLNAVLGQPVQWLPDQKSLLVKLAVDGEPPLDRASPIGPSVQETLAGQKAQVRTNQDMLQNEHDAQWFSYLATCQLARVDAATGVVTPYGKPLMIASVDTSPDGTCVLLTCLQRPFSYLVPWRSFPTRTELWDRDGVPMRLLYDAPLEENVPIGGVPVGPRMIRWVPLLPHALVWFEALDGGDPKSTHTPRDRLQLLTDLTANPTTWAAFAHRAQGLSFGAGQQLVLLSEVQRETRRQRVYSLALSELSQGPVMLYERSAQDVYGDPGTPVSEVIANGEKIMRQRGTRLFRAGDGASQDGGRPFLDSWDPGAGIAKRLWQCEVGRYEQFVAFLDEDRILIRSESPSEPSNLYEVFLATGARKAITNFRDPAQDYAGKIAKELLRYTRADGVALSGTLYLPPSHQPGDTHPVLIWAYPQEFTQASDAGQVRSAPTRYTVLAGSSHLWMLLHGYAVLDDAAMPIIGPLHSANDTYVQQLVWNAAAAVQMLCKKGIADPKRIAVAGHSYGAFMTANLLVHSKLFAAGIARSGAYNRTLTPFGFQNEERTFWEAPEVYQAMSPFAHADQIKTPILLIHGEDDDNQGTWPIQSLRFYAAIKGHGGTARLCLLPNEAHGYRGRESTLQCLAEMCAWLDRFVKNAH